MHDSCHDIAPTNITKSTQVDGQKKAANAFGGKCCITTYHTVETCVNHDQIEQTFNRGCFDWGDQILLIKEVSGVVSC